MGSDYGTQLINPANLGSANSAFTPLSTVTGKVLAISTNGSIALFSDTLHTPNEVLVVNTSNPTSTSVTTLNISGASAASFSPDGLKAFIFGFDGTGNPNLYVYSALQALQVIPLPPQTTVNTIAFSTNGAFAYVAEPSLGGGAPAVSVFNTCDNKVFTDTLTGLHDIPLSAPPIAFKALPDGVHFVVLESGGIIDYITATITGVPAATLTTPSSLLCPMTVGHAPPQKINLGQGTIQPINFFISADGTLLYVLASDRASILVYNFNTNSVSGIQLAGNATPVSADMTSDASTILVAGSDGLLHQVTTGLGGSDMVQISFPNVPNFLNPFCSMDPAQGPCTLNLVAAKP
jgi:DNA-binding beta-propeller fold protein YncE